MKAVILAGGLGTRLSEETEVRPKPMVEIGGRPILWHIMKMYSAYGINDFIICLGYKGYLIKEYFSNYSMHMSDITFDMRKHETIVHQRQGEPWSVTLVDTGDSSMTGGRIREIRRYVEDDDMFCLTYGDGVADIDITALLDSHRSSGKLATVTAVKPPGRFGTMILEDGDDVTAFEEKPAGDGNWINGGFFVLSPKVIDLVTAPETIWEQEPMRRLAQDRQLHAYRHEGYWQCMDTLRDKRHLEELWSNGTAPWRKW